MELRINSLEDRVRRVLCAGKDDLPDSLIQQYEYAGAAEEQMKARFPQWRTFSAEKEKVFEVCVVYRTAELLLPVCEFSADNIKSEKTTHTSTEYFANNAAGKQKRVHEALQEYMGMLRTERAGFFFGVDLTGSGKRR